MGLKNFSFMLLIFSRDFSLKIPNAKFQYLKHPESFRASLRQIGNEGSKAFQEAHSAMLNISLSTLMIQEFLEDSIWIIALNDRVSILQFTPIIRPLK